MAISFYLQYDILLEPFGLLSLARYIVSIWSVAFKSLASDSTTICVRSETDSPSLWVFVWRL